MCVMCTQYFDSILTNDGYDHRIRIHDIGVHYFKTDSCGSYFFTLPEHSNTRANSFSKTFILFSK